MKEREKIFVIKDAGIRKDNIRQCINEEKKFILENENIMVTDFRLCDESLILIYKDLSSELKTELKTDDEAPDRKHPFKNQKPEKVNFPLDKVSAVISTLTAEHNKQEIPIAVEKKGSNKEINIYLTIDFDELDTLGIKAVKRMTEFDKRVYVAISAIFYNGYTETTLTQIHYAMGNKKRPSYNQLEKIRESIIRMQKISLHVDNREEAETYKNHKRVKYDGQLLSTEMVTTEETTNAGKRLDGVIKIHREPFLSWFARIRRQVVTIPMGVLQSPISKTEGHLAIEHYLLTRLARKKKSKRCKILFKTFYDRIGANDKKKEQRAKEDAEKYLDHYIETGQIGGYETGKDGFEITYKD